MPEQKKKEAFVKYHELKRPLTKKEKREIKEKNFIEDPQLFDKLATSVMVSLTGGLAALAAGIAGIGIAKIATTVTGALGGVLLGAAGYSAALCIGGKLVFDACRYFSDRHKRIHALEQEETKKITERDSQELQRVREAKIAEAQGLQKRFDEGLTPVVERRKKEFKEKQASKPENTSGTKKQGPSQNGRIPRDRDDY